MGKIRFYFNEVTTTLGSLTDQEKFDLPPLPRTTKSKRENSDYLIQKLLRLTLVGAGLLLLLAVAALAWTKLL